MTASLTLEGKAGQKEISLTIMEEFDAYYDN
jgi:hypothetical protein